MICGTHEKATEVILSFTPQQGRYIKSLPPHQSQNLIQENKEEIRFSYFIKPTYDFKMELLSYGGQVKILEPESLKQTIIENLQGALNRY